MSGPYCFYPLYVSYDCILDSVLKSQVKTRNRYGVILIGGCSQSGKTTLADRLKEDLNGKGIDSCTVRLDNWIKDIRLRTGAETVRERYDYESIVTNVERLLAGHTISPPFYDSKTRRVIYEHKGQSLTLGTASVAIVEGVVALDIEPLRKIAEQTVFVDIPDGIRKERLTLFYTTHKACSPEETKLIIASREKEEVPIIKRTMVLADHVYSGEGERHCG